MEKPTFPEGWRLEKTSYGGFAQGGFELFLDDEKVAHGREWPDDYPRCGGRRRRTKWVLDHLFVSGEAATVVREVFEQWADAEVAYDKYQRKRDAADAKAKAAARTERLNALVLARRNEAGA